jgi:hypothetical protein
MFSTDPYRPLIDLCSYLTLPLPYLTTALAFESDQEADQFLSDHKAAIYTNANLPASKPVVNNAWRTIHRPTPTPLHERIWDCKKAHAACAAAMQKYRVVDLKGQVD